MRGYMPISSNSILSKSESLLRASEKMQCLYRIFKEQMHLAIYRVIRLNSDKTAALKKIYQSCASDSLIRNPEGN